MCYSWNRVRWQLRYHWKLYFFIISEYAIGIIILLTCTNIFISSGDTLKEMKNSMSEDSISVSCLGSLDQYPIDYDTYLKLSEKYRKELMISFAYTSKMDYFIHNTYKSMNIVFMNKTLFEDLFGFEQNDNNVYVGKEAYNLIRTIVDKSENGTDVKDYKSVNEEFLSYTNEKINILGLQNYNIIQLGNNVRYINKSFDLYNDNIEVKDTVIFSLNSFVNIKNVSPYFPNCIFRLKSAGNRNAYDAMASLVADLSRLQEGNLFSLDDKYLRMKNSVDTLNIKYEDYFVMSCAVLLIVMTGITGILLIFLYRRKKSMAISMAYGATMGRIAAELFAEIFFVLFFGCLIGLVGAFIFTYKVDLFYTKVAFHLQSGMLSVGITFLGAVASCSLALLGIKKEAPIRVLKDM